MSDDLLAREEEEVRHLEDFLDELHVSLGDMRIYGARHRVTVKRVYATWQKLGVAHRSFGTLKLVAGIDGLSWRGVLIRSEDDARPGIGRLLHREGIKSLTIEPGIEHREFVALLSVLRINLSLPEHEEETLDSLLWQAGLTHVTAEALTELQEAEVLSGQAWLRGDADLAGQVIRDLLDIRVDERTTRRKIDSRLTEEAVHRAIARSDLTGLGGEGDGSHQLAEQGEWEQRLNVEGSRDHARLAVEREAVSKETPGDLLARLVLVLARAAVADRSELAPDQAVAFARSATAELFRRTMPGGLLRVLEQLPPMVDRVPPGDTRRRLRGLVEELSQPTRVSRMLLDLDPARHTDEEGLRRLVEWLPDAALEQVLEMAARDGTDERGRWLLEILGAAAQGRFEAWLGELHRQPQERVVALLGLLRGLNSDVGRQRRSELMKSPSRRVQQSVLEWYVDDLPAEDVDAVLPCVVDRHAGVRRAARAVLARHKPSKAYTWLRMAVLSNNYARMDAPTKKDLCICLGEVGGELGVDVLRDKLQAKTSMFGKEEEAADLQAAALGLAAIGTLGAKVVLKKGASSLNGKRRAACQQALQSLEWAR